MGYGRGIQAGAVSTATRRRCRGGFTLIELLIVIVLGTVVAAALYQVLVYQQRLYTTERAATYRHDALRLASAVLTADLMEASAPEGDLLAITADSLSVRSPVGFGVACVVDSVTGTLGLFNVKGRLGGLSGDSLLIYHPSGWLVRELGDSGSESSVSLSCAYASGPSVEREVRVDGALVGVPVGAPVRAFHRYSYRLEEEGGSWWLARADASGSEILAGPLSEESSGLRFEFFDAAGQPTTDPARVARLELTLVAESEPLERLDTLTSTVRPRNR